MSTPFTSEKRNELRERMIQEDLFGVGTPIALPHEVLALLDQIDEDDKQIAILDDLMNQQWTLLNILRDDIKQFRDKVEAYDGDVRERDSEIEELQHQIEELHRVARQVIADVSIYGDFVKRDGTKSDVYRPQSVTELANLLENKP